jgi:hypothetical protein
MSGKTIQRRRRRETSVLLVVSLFTRVLLLSPVLVLSKVPFLIRNLRASIDQVSTKLHLCPLITSLLLLFIARSSLLPPTSTFQVSVLTRRPCWALGRRESTSGVNDPVASKEQLLEALRCLREMKGSPDLIESILRALDEIEKGKSSE